MTLVRVPVANTVGKTVRIDTDASPGATIGKDLKLPDGTVPTMTELAAALALGNVQQPSRSDAYIYWNQILGLYDFIKFDTSFADTAEEGVLHWDTDVGTLAFGLPGGGHEHFVGQELILRVRNTSGAQIINGSVVRITGASGNKPLIALADATDDATAHAIGVTTEDIDNNSNGYMAVSGLVRDVDTDGMTPGNVIFLSETAGEFTESAPASPAHHIHVGHVIAAHASTGVIHVELVDALDFCDMSDVNLTGQADDDMLHRVGGLWVPTLGALTFDGTDLVCGGDVSGVTIGGIAEANLVSKIVAEHILSGWVFEVNPEVNNTSPAFRWVDNDGATDETRFTVRYQGGQVRFQNRTDLDAGPVNWLTMDRTGMVTDDITLTATAIQLVGAVTGTSFGGITEANLVDKTAVELVTGAWTFDAGTFQRIHNVAGGLSLLIKDTGGAGSVANPYIGFYDSNEARLGYMGFGSAGNSTMYVYNDSGNVEITGTVVNVTGALTAVSYGGITEANLLDKSAAEVISAVWTFNNRPTLNAALWMGNNLQFQQANFAGSTKSSLQMDASDRLQVGDASIETILRGSSVTVVNAFTCSAHLALARYTTAQLADVTHAVNTSDGKIDGAMVWNLTTNMPVFANGSADADVWFDAAQNTVHSPI